MTKKKKVRKTKKDQKKTKSNKRQISTTFVDNLIAYLNATPDKPFSLRRIFKALNIHSKKDKNTVQSLLHDLAVEGKIMAVGNSYQAIVNTDSIRGKVDYVNPKFAYIVVDDADENDKDIWVSTNNLNKALNGDHVEVTTFYNPKRNRTEGKVVNILERFKSEFVGHIEISDRFAFVVTSDRKMHFDIFINKDNLKDAQNGDKVVAEITRWRDKDRNPIGRITKLLGKAGDNETEIHAIMFEYGLPFEFPVEVEAEAELIPDEISEEEIKNRRDFREKTTFTIDPLTAKDFDDALSIRKMRNGHYEIGVHIADVSHYVRPGSILDQEAIKRATSVYLVDRTIPMLPEKLSNGLCSLNPHVDRLAFSSVFELDTDGKIYKQWFGRTVIHSDRRFTYEEAQERIESKEGDFAEEINILNDIAYKLRDKRFQEGSISFESVEFRFELDEEGKPIGLFPRIRKDAHKMIEDYMLLANKRVAEYVHRKKEQDKPVTMVYRVHEPPSPEKLFTLNTFIKRFGYELDLDEKKLAQSFNNLSEKVEGRPEQNIVEQQAIRSMSKAKYTTEILGHYGLGFKHYTHFTSPIRRYPDVMSHRLLQHYLCNGKSVPPSELEDKCKHSSDMEKRAAEAERASVKYKQVEFMEKYIGEEMKGTVSGVTEWGIYVELEDTRCEGMVRISSMEDDQYYYDDENMQVIGRRYKNTYQLGDEVRILVKETNVEKRTIDFEML